jgi:hypothetical protein
VLSVYAPWWPSEESDWTEIWSVRSGDLVVHLYVDSASQKCDTLDFRTRNSSVCTHAEQTIK